MKQIEKDADVLKEFQEAITGIGMDEDQAIYYRKELTYIGKNMPKLKVPQKFLPRFVPMTQNHNSPRGELVNKNIRARDKMIGAVDPTAACCIKEMGYDDIIASYQHPIHKNERIRIDEDEPKRQQTSAQKLLSDQDKAKETSMKLRKLFEDRLPDF